MDGAKYGLHEKFQSTPPHGRRRGCGSWMRNLLTCFNPRLRTGGDAYGTDLQDG